ncbi:MAG: hypothetical protein AB7O37_14625 [Vicinamibacteria bacterium]
MGRGLLGDEWSAGGRLPHFVAVWLRTVDDGVRASAERAPFMYYGTDWLAFGHFMIAIAFVGALRDPVRNRWLFEFGMIACACVPVWALAFGELRGIPLWWRAIDASFGIVGFVPAWLGHRWTGELERVGAGRARRPSANSPRGVSPTIAG